MNGHTPQAPQGYYGDKQNTAVPNGHQHPHPAGHDHQHAHAPANAYPSAQKLPNKFQFGLFDCFSPMGTCCLSCWCPCVQFQKTYARDRGDQDPSGMGPMCVAYCFLLWCGVSPILQCINRGSMQEKYGIKSNMVANCCGACFCSGCQLVQEEKESIVRNTGKDPKTNQPYVPVGGMTYP